MAITQATSSVLAANAALNNLNAGASIVFTRPLTVANFTANSGSTFTLNSTSYVYGTGAAAAHRTALGLTALATTTPAANVATFLATPTSANLAAAVSDETGTGSLVFGTSPTISGATMSGATKESPFNIGNSGTAVTLSLANGTFQQVTLTGNCTFTMPTAVSGSSFTLQILTGAGSFAGIFTSVRWQGAVSPTITTTASRVDIVSFLSDGTNWYGSIAQNYTV